MEKLVESINKIEHFLHERRWILKQQQMVEAGTVDIKPLMNYTIPTNEKPHYSIVHLPIVANNFEIKPSLVGMV